MEQQVSKSNGVLSPDDAKKAIEADKKKRSDACSKELADVLKKHNCTMDVATVLRSGQNPTHQLSVIANG